MSRRWPLGWTLVDENIENVERVKLDPAAQRELGCFVGEHVFLEYPWAYVQRHVVVKFAKLPSSPLAVFREKIEAYEADNFLIGYSSDQLISDQFVICLSEKAERDIRARNRNIGIAIWRDVFDRMWKTAKPWNSLGSDSEIDETFAKRTRELFEIEIVRPARTLTPFRTLSDRDASDCRDGYVQLVATPAEEFENIVRKCMCRTVQTHSEQRETFVQTHLGDPRNAWTQYVYEDTLRKDFEIAENVNDEETEGNDTVNGGGEENDEKPEERTALQTFLNACSQQVIDIARYNAVLNPHVDHIQNLSRRDHRIEMTSVLATFHERVSFADIGLLAGRPVSDVAMHPTFGVECIAISYRLPSHDFSTNELASEAVFQPRALIWKYSDPHRPRFVLQDHREICSISFCSYNTNLVIGGRSTGQMVVWNTNGYPTGDKCPTTTAAFRPVAVSEKDRSHRLPIRKIQWLPAKYRIGPSGNLTESVPSTAQFLTISEDGTLAVWDLFDPMDENFAASFQPILRLIVRDSNGDTRQKLSPLCVCLPVGGASRFMHESGASKKAADRAKSLWIGCMEGLIEGAWSEEMPHERSTEFVECVARNRSSVHGGRVTEIARSPHLSHILLTIGGQVFAIWEDDCMDFPLFWRRASSGYACCCWASAPGVFLLGCGDGIAEIWDIKNESNRPIFLRVLSAKSITRLTMLRHPSDTPVEIGQMIGVADSGGLFRVFDEPNNVRTDDDTFEGRATWFEKYTRREARRKKVFVDWQNDFLARDSTVTAKRSASRSDAVRRETEEARQRLWSERETRSRLLIAENRADTAPIRLGVVAWKSQQLDDMKKVLLRKKGLIPSELEARMQPAVAQTAERDKIRRKIREKVTRRETYYKNILTLQFPELSESNASATTEKPEEAIEFGTSMDRIAEKFSEIRRKTRDLLKMNMYDHVD